MKNTIQPFKLVFLFIFLILNPSSVFSKMVEQFKTTRHNQNCYTQGLFFINSTHLFESCGMYNLSYFHILRYKSDKNGFTITEEYTSNIPYRNDVFFQGSTLMNGRIYILTWRQNIVFVLDAKNLKEINTKRWDKQGWGLTTNSTHLFISDGSSKIYLCNEDLTILQEKTIIDQNNRMVSNINELEYIDGYIWANVYFTNRLIKIDFSKGKVVEEHDGSKLSKNQKNRQRDEVINGIAYNKQSKKFILTGKYWSNYYEVTL